MSNVTFGKFTAEEHEDVQRIVERARSLWLRMIGQRLERRDIMMDLSAVRGDLGDSFNVHVLAESNEFDFAHDMGGIMRHLDRTTGKLGGCFLPRCAR